MKKPRKRPNHLIIKDMIEGGHRFVFCLKNFKKRPDHLSELMSHDITDEFDIVSDVSMGYGEYTVHGIHDEYDSFDKDKPTLTPFDLETGRIIVGFDKETDTILLDGDVSRSISKSRNNGWISVDDALPTKPDVYTVYCPNNICFQSKKEMIQVVSFHPDIGWNSSYLITHWQPLPEFPK